MKTGRVWAGDIEGIPVQVVYTRHFLDRFQKDEGDRPAVSRYVDEPEILEVILDALPGITDTWRSSWDHSGVITSKGLDLNMSFITETDQDGMKVVMKNMMLKHAYQAHSEDYVFAVAGTKDPELGIAVASHLASLNGRRLKPGRIETPEAIFSLAMGRRGPRISKAAWKYDTYVYEVR